MLRELMNLDFCFLLLFAIFDFFLPEVPAIFIIKIKDY